MDKSRPIVLHLNPSLDDTFRTPTDAFAFDDELNIFAIADAPLRILTRNTKNYPHEDLGQLSSRTWCESFVKAARQAIKTDRFSIEDLKSCLLSANNSIKLLNEDLGRYYSDFEHYDIAECVGMGAVVFENQIFYGGLEDTYVMIQDGATLEDKHEYNYQIMNSKKFLDQAGENGEFSKIQNSLQDILKGHIWEAYWCNTLRNNREIVDKNSQKVGWGCFTGEDSVADFLHLHTRSINPGDHLLLLTNGMIKAVNNPDFIKSLFNEAEPTFESSKKLTKMINELYRGDTSENSEKLLIYKKL